MRINYHESSVCFVYPKIPAKILPTPKNPKIENFKPPKNLSTIPVTWNPEYPPEKSESPWRDFLQKVRNSGYSFSLISFTEGKLWKAIEKVGFQPFLVYEGR